MKKFFQTLLRVVAFFISAGRFIDEFGLLVFDPDDRTSIVYTRHTLLALAFAAFSCWKIISVEIYCRLSSGKNTGRDARRSGEIQFGKKRHSGLGTIGKMSRVSGQFPFRFRPSRDVTPDAPLVRGSEFFDFPVVRYVLVVVVATLSVSETQFFSGSTVRRAIKKI